MVSSIGFHPRTGPSIWTQSASPCSPTLRFRARNTVRIDSFNGCWLPRSPFLQSPRSPSPSYSLAHFSSGKMERGSSQGLFGVLLFGNNFILSIGLTCVFDIHFRLFRPIYVKLYQRKRPEKSLLKAILWLSFVHLLFFSWRIFKSTTR